MIEYIPYGRQDINKSDIDAVIEVLRSDFLTQGPAIEVFEQAICDQTGARFAVALSSATAGLHLACLGLGVGVGDYVWTSPNTFVASANCARYCGANIDFIDIEIDTGNLCIDSLKKKLESAEKNNCLPKIIIPVHYSGRSCDMQALSFLAEKYGFFILEDAAHAIGATYQGHAVGLCKYSKATIFSFHPVKIITTGEGGAITTNDEALYRKLIRLRSHGITRAQTDMTHVSDGGWYYQQLELGFNYRMTDIQAALGCSQLLRINEFVAKRRALAIRYREELANLNIDLMRADADQESAWHLFVIQVDETKRKLIYEQLRSAGIGVNVHYIPVYLQPYYLKLGFNIGHCPVAEKYYHRVLSLPIFPSLNDQDFNYVIHSLSNALVN